MKNIKYFLLFTLGFIVLSSCKKDEDDPVNPDNTNEVELITTVKLIFTDQSNTSNVIESMFKDTDGDGGNPPVINTIQLENNKTYDVEILLLDETKTPVDTISHEVEEEGDEHQFFFSVSGGANVTIDPTDTDVNGVPIGLKSVWTVGAASTGEVQVVLKHQGEDKPDTGDGDSTIGDTDIEVSFPVIIQ